MNLIHETRRAAEPKHVLVSDSVCASLFLAYISSVHVMCVSARACFAVRRFSEQLQQHYQGQHRLFPHALTAHLHTRAHTHTRSKTDSTENTMARSVSLRFTSLGCTRSVSARDGL